jgi:SAM-dependent methyltransferase
MDPNPASEPIIGDAFGLALLDHLDHGSDAREHFIERDDGYLESFDSAIYFTGESVWSETEAGVSDRAGSRVLDVGAGAGRHALPFQESGRDVVALDISPGATEVCRRRGLRRTFTGTVFELADEGTEPFDTVLLFGNNFGLLESPGHAPRFFEALNRVTRSDSEIIGTCLDPFDTTDPTHLGYHELNRGRGRLPGQLRLRSRWANVATPWFDYLFVPIEELAVFAEAAGWDLVFHQPGPRPYVAVLHRG